MNNEELLKEKCKALIEEKLGWGDSNAWTNRDFDSLSEKIFQVTGINLSQTTLKRIWGKVKYESAPTVTTLDTLALFLGFENWRDFRQKNFSSAVTTQPPLNEPDPPASAPINNRKRWFRIIPILLLLMIGVIASRNLFSSKSPARKNASTPAYKFSSKKILSLGVPNSVVFEYDASASPDDSVFIQQSWDNRLRVQVSKDQHLHTSIYYYPGFFQAKLVTGHQIVKQQDVFIQTDGWLTLVEQDPVPMYFKKADGLHDGRLGLTTGQLTAKHIPLTPAVPTVFYANIREFGDLQTDDFILETAVQNNYQEGSGACQKTEIRLLCEGSMISIPLSAKGCISENNLFCLGYFRKGSGADLSGFGVDFNHFAKVRLKISRGEADFFINDKPVYHIDSLSMHSKIKGIVYRFQGTGSVDWIRLTKGNGEPVYEETF